MSAWTCSLGWFRFTVSDSTADEVIARVGGEWIKDKKGFLGYRQGWLSRGHAGGLGRIGTAAIWAPREVHVDLSQELISDWTYQKFHDVATWVFEKHGHFWRIDVALDDRNGVIDVDRIYAAVKAGHCVSHFRQSRLIAGLDLGSGSDTGKTLCMGSRQSDTYLRIYDKAAEQRSKEKPVDGTWIRWEMEWKAERADAVGMALSGLDQDSFQKYIVGVFRSALDFRDCTRADDPKDRYHAPLLDWWKVLTEGMQRARLEIATSVKKIEEVKRWAEKTVQVASVCAMCILFSQRDLPNANWKWPILPDLLPHHLSITPSKMGLCISSRVMWIDSIEGDFATLPKALLSGSSAQIYPIGGAGQDSNQEESAVVKRSYSRATFHSFQRTPAHSLSGHKPFTIQYKSRETGVNIEGAVLARNQIPPSAPITRSTVYELNFGTYTYIIKTTLSWRTLGMRGRMWENCTHTLAENSEDCPLNGESPETRKTR